MFKEIKTESSADFFTRKKEEREKFGVNSPEVSLDVEFFKRSIFLHYQHIYATQKWQNWLYRFIFFSFGCLFTVLSIIIFIKTTNFLGGSYLSAYSFLIKNSINFSCIVLAAIAFVCGYKIHPEKEAVRYLMNKVERELKSPEKYLQIEFNAILANIENEQLTSHQMVWIRKTIPREHVQKAKCRVD